MAERRGRRIVAGEGPSSVGGSLTLSERFTKLQHTKIVDDSRALRRQITTARQSNDRYNTLMRQRKASAPSRGGKTRGGKGGGRGASRGTGKGRGGGRGGRGGRGGKGGRGRGKNSNRPLTKEALDAELESYMFKDEESAKSYLDKELDEYMAATKDRGSADNGTSEDVEVGETVKPDETQEKGQ